MIIRAVTIALMLLTAFAESPNPTSESSVIYSPVGKRDPFKAPALEVLGRDLASVSPLERFSVEQFQLKAILTNKEKPHAMLEDPEGKTHLITEGDVIGRERATVSR